MSYGCVEWRGDLGAYVIGALEEDERAAVRQHLAACPACRADYEYFLPVRDWLTQTKRHLAACRECQVDYEELLLPNGTSISGCSRGRARASVGATTGRRAASAARWRRSRPP